MKFRPVLLAVAMCTVFVSLAQADDAEVNSSASQVVMRARVRDSVTVKLGGQTIQDPFLSALLPSGTDLHLDVKSNLSSASRSTIAIEASFRPYHSDTSVSLEFLPADLKSGLVNAFRPEEIPSGDPASRTLLIRTPRYLRDEPGMLEIRVDVY